jgi:broad specificity phosphatase PhoE
MVMIVKMKCSSLLLILVSFSISFSESTPSSSTLSHTYSSTSKSPNSSTAFRRHHHTQSYSHPHPHPHPPLAFQKLPPSHNRIMTKNNSNKSSLFSVSKAGVIYKPIESESDLSSSTTSTVSTTPKKKSKKLILIRHGRSLANDMMDRPGNRWGDHTFTDDATLVDTSLSANGVKQAEALREKLSTRFLVVGDTDVNTDVDTDADSRMDISTSNNNAEKIPVDDNLLVVTSPLRRCIETMSIGVLPNILIPNSSHNNNDNNNNDRIQVKILVQPLATERVYTASDTGRPVEEIEKDYPHLDFDTCFRQYRYQSMDSDSDSTSKNKSKSWWYAHDDDKDAETYQEWRPHGNGQYYAAPGEPSDVFHKRMIRLLKWIKSREEQTIVLVCHWGVIRWMTGREDTENCEVKELEVDRLIPKDEIVKSNL